MRQTDSPTELLELVRRNFNRMFSLPGEAGIELLKNSENVTFTVQSQAERGVLRVNRPMYHTTEELLAELQWMEQIHLEGKLAIAKVYCGRNGSPLQTFFSPNSGIEYRCSLFSYLPGEVMRRLHEGELAEKMQEIGAIAARLHEQVQRCPRLKKLNRPVWDYGSLLGENACWGSWREYPGLTQKDRKLFQAAADIIRSRLSVYGKASDRYGLIHSDLHSSNVIINRNQLQIIDFDDCGYGWFLYDLGCSVVEYSGHLEELTQAWLRGYQKIRRLSPVDLAEAPTFVLLRRIVRLAWLSSHSQSDTAREVGPEYLEKTREMAGEYIVRSTQGESKVC